MRAAVWQARVRQPVSGPKNLDTNRRSDVGQGSCIDLDRPRTRVIYRCGLSWLVDAGDATQIDGDACAASS
jgi:hypothetical protein